uniref:Uncharacterized protein n=1 Tax=Tetranychus urticae TaxID=32264 RepID=T1L2J1_TETUR
MDSVLIFCRINNLTRNVNPKIKQNPIEGNSNFLKIKTDLIGLQILSEIAIRVCESTGVTINKTVQCVKPLKLDKTIFTFKR